MSPSPLHLTYKPLTVYVLHITYRPGTTLIHPAHADTHSASLSHKLAMEAAEDYVQEVHDYNTAAYGPDRPTFYRDPASELQTRWTLAYWATMKTQVHVTLVIREMFVLPTEMFDVESSGCNVDMGSSDDS